MSHTNYACLTILLVALGQSMGSGRFKDPGICGRPTCKVSHKFGYKEKVDYTYKYSMVSNVNFDGAGSSSAEMKFNFLFTMQFRSKCEGILKIRNAEIESGSDGNNTMASPENLEILTKNILRFHYDDGTIPEICPEDDDPIWAVNIKRGILSLIQNTMDRFDVDQGVMERDVNGDCFAGYFFREINGTTLVNDKKIDVSTCTNRYLIYSIVPMTPYVFQKKYHKWTPMNSSIFCSQHIDHKVLTVVNCQERHEFQPFYNQTNGAKTTAKSELKLVSELSTSYIELEKIKKMGLISFRSNLLFDHQRPLKTNHDNLNICKRLLISLCDINTMEFQPKYTEYFTKFIHVARDLSLPSLSQLFSESNHICESGRTQMLDALPYVRSRASTKIMTDIIMDSGMSNSTINEWLFIMAFVPRPDAETVDAVAKLVLSDNCTAQAALTVSTVIHNFCERSKYCEKQESVVKVMNKLEDIISTSCLQKHDNKVYSALKAVGNSGVITDTLNITLQTCINNSLTPIDVRILSIEAHRRLPCTTNRDFLLDIYSNQSIEGEVRISAYLQVMRCPTYSTLKVIKTSLEMEEFNQVGSFVWSHLKTTMKSSFPNRVEVQAMLEDERFNNKFDKDFRKFSRNYESSFYLNEYGVGGFIETNVLFSQKSFIPKVVTFNTTINLFGETLNLCEVTFYIQGMDSVFEKIFHKDGILGKELFEKAMRLVRVIRSSSNPLQSLINELPYTLNIDDIKLSISLKMFGNELTYLQIVGVDEFLSEIKKLNPMKIIRIFFSGQEINFKTSSMLIDTSYVTPMMIGLPLRLNAIGTASIKIDAKGYVNATKFSSDKELFIKGKLVPSIGLSLKAAMELDAFVATTGVKFKGTVYTSTALEGSFTTMKNLTFLQVAFNLPLEKSDIVHAETHLILMVNDEEKELKGITADREENHFCSWSIIDETIGLKLCANTLLPNKDELLKSPLFLFSGPFKLGVTLEKSDPTAKLYIIEYKLETINNKTMLIFKFDTPGSNTKRGMKAVVDLDPQSQNLTLAYQSSLSQVQAEGYYRNTPTEKLINFGLDVNGMKHIDIQVGVDITEEKYGNTYYPRVLFAINNKRIVSLSGSISWVKKKGLSQCHIELDFQMNSFTTVITGYGRLSDVSFATNIKMDYKFGGNKTETVKIELKLDNKSSKFLTNYTSQLQLESTAYPEINLVLSVKFQKAQSHVDCRLNMLTNPYIKDDAQKLRVRWDYQQFKAFSINKLNTSLEIAKPNSGIDLKLAFIKQNTPNNSSSKVIVKYAKGKEIIITFDMNIPHGSLFYFENRLRVMITPALEQMSIFVKVFEKSPNDYDVEFFGVWFSGHNLTIRGMFQDQSDPFVSSYNFKILARSQIFSDLLLSGKYLNREEEFKTDIQAEYNDVNYGLGFHHLSEFAGLYETFAEIMYDSAVYSFTNYLDLIKRKTVLELHLDQYRDVHISLHGITNKSSLDAGIDMKWDANRDPSQKFTAILLTHSHGNINFDGKCIIEYPGRIITSYFNVQHKLIHYSLFTKIQWSPTDIIVTTFNGVYDMDINKFAKIEGKVETPFKHWECMSLAYQMKIDPQILKMNGTLVWKRNEKMDLEVSYRYNFTSESNYIIFISEINSTIPEVNSVKAILKFSQVDNKFMTELIVQPSPSNKFAVELLGEKTHEANFSHYHIFFGILTPFETVKSATVNGDLFIYPKKKFKGNIQFIGDGKKYVTTIDGDFFILKESKLNFHINTPFEKYTLTTGRYAFSASNKHFILEIRSPNISAGADVIYIYNNISNFDLKLKAHASVSFVSSLLIVGKRDLDTIDVRIGWKTLLIGFVGRSHYRAWNDVDYSLQLFTPFEGYNKGSAIAKLIYDEKLDLETYVNLGEKKIGLKVQAMKRPDQDFAVPFSEDLAQMYLSNNETYIEPFNYDEIEYGNTYWRGIFQFDSTLYPTVHGLLQVNDDGAEYYAISYLSFPFGILKLTDTLKYNDIMNFKNYMNILTTCNCLREGEINFSIGGLRKRNIKSDLTASAVIFNSSYTIETETIYIYIPVSEEHDSEGFYNISVRAKTPFTQLSHGFANALLKAESPIYVGNVTVEMNNSTVYMDGTLENDGSIFSTDVGVKMNTAIFKLPMCRLMLSKDFTDFEKEIKVGLALPNERGDSLVTYGVSLAWHYDGPQYMKYVLSIITPYPSIGTIKNSVSYSNDPILEEYFLELYLKYSKLNEITAWSSVKRSFFNFHVLSTSESFRNISINGTLKNKGNVRSLDAVLSWDKEYKMIGWATINPKRPFVVEAKLFKTSTNSEVFGLSLSVHKKENRYDISSLIQRFDQRINILCDYVIVEDTGKLLNMMFSSTYPGYEKFVLYAELLTTNNKTMVSKVNGEIVSKWLTTQAQLNLNTSLEEDLGIIKVNLLNRNISADGQISWVNKPLEHISFDIFGTGTYLNISRKINGHFYMWNFDSEFREISLGTDINYNSYDWWLSANATILWPFWNDLEFVSHAILPHKTDHHHIAIAKLFYEKNWAHNTFVLKYTANPRSFNFDSMIEISVEPNTMHGTVLLQTGKHRIYDQIVTDSKENQYDIRNVLQSTNLKEDLTVDVFYKKVDKHKVHLIWYYPEPVPYIETKLEFSTLNNLFAEMNCSTPFKAFPRILVFLKLVTTRPFYQRYIEVLWSNQSALFNYTHASTWEKSIQITDGNILMDFPLTSRHTGFLNYKYESTETNAQGGSSLSYNKEIIMSGNYSRRTIFTEKSTNEVINISVNNSFLPTGIVYVNNYNQENASHLFPNRDLRRIELYKLNDVSAFNITGEIEVKKNYLEKNVTLRVIHSKRRVVIETISDGKNIFTSQANFTLRPSIWGSCGFNVLNKELKPGKTIEFIIAYPRRYFSIKGNYEYSDELLTTEITLLPNKFKSHTQITGGVYYVKDPPKNSQNISLILAHPSFHKNLTLTGRHFKSEEFPLRFEVDFEYSSDVNKKLSFYSFIKNKSTIPIINYEYNAFGDHPASRLKLTSFGYIKLSNEMIDIRENITYRRSYLPLSFWYNGFIVNIHEKMFELERNSLREFSYLYGRYGKEKTKHIVNGILLNGKDTKILGEYTFDIKNCVTGLQINLTSDGSEKLCMEGWYKENRHSIFNVWRTYDDISISDFSFYTKLNHSRLLTSYLIWRPEIQTDLTDMLHSVSNYIMNYATETANFWTQYFKTEIYESTMDVWFDAKPIIQDFLDDVRDIRDLQEDISHFKEVFKQSFDENEFYMQDIYKMYMDLAEEMSFRDRMSHVPKIVNELWEVMGETGETIRQSILWLVESAKKVYSKIVEFVRGLITGETIDKISEYLQKIAGKYDKMIREVHISFLHYVEQLWTDTVAIIYQYWSKTLKVVEPTFIQFTHHTESVFWEASKKILEFLYARQSELLSSPVFTKNKNLTKNLDDFYNDIANNDFLTNLKKYANMVIELIQQKYFSAVPFGNELNQIGSEIVGEMKEVYKLPFVNFTMEVSKEFYYKFKWVYNYFNIQEKLQKFIPVLYNVIIDYSHTALENELINHGARTKFVFEPDKGKIILEQKLPMPWHSFNETPNYEEIMEYKILRKIQSVISPSNNSIWAFYYKLAPLAVPSKWLPPYTAQAVIIGERYFISFDGNHIESNDDCSYLLAKDFVDNSFSLVSKYEYRSHILLLMTKDAVIFVDLQKQVVGVEDNTNFYLPLQIGDTFIYAEEGLVTIQNNNGIKLHCNLKFKVCLFELSGWYFGKIAGLLGTVDNEPKTDFYGSNGILSMSRNNFIDSWKLGNCVKLKEVNHYPNMLKENISNIEQCQALFNAKSSYFSTCYSVINPQPYFKICQNNVPDKYTDRICTSAYAYIQACREKFVPLKMPTFCVLCPLMYGDIIQEGDFTKLESDLVPQSTDVVFIMEAKECNQYLRDRRIVHTFVSILSKELISVGISKNRYAVVTYGGNGVFDPPHNIVVKNQVFTDENDLPNYFEKIVSGNGNTDIFNALRYATKLQYRAGVSKTFILIPCSDCDLANMTIEYNVLNQAFLEQNITLHVLMNADFDFEKLRVSKMFYGLDSERAFTKSDFKVMKGDMDLRRQIKLTKSMMGYCTTLALETNGTIFTGKKMGSENLALVKKFSSVFARRIAASAHPDSCQQCECLANAEGIDFIDCIPCAIPVPAYTDFEFQENGTRSFWQALEPDNF